MRCIIPIFLMLSLLVSSTVAQQRSGSDAGRRVDSNFSREAPAVGEPVPDITVYRADGEAVQLSRLLEGHYSVLVFGCLT